MADKGMVDAGMVDKALVELRDVTRRFASRSGDLIAVDGVSLSLRRGETIGIVGESGSGKSTLGRMVVGLERPTSGQILVEGVDLGTSSLAERRQRLRRVQMVFQDPYSSLNPRMPIGRQIGESLVVQGTLSRADITRTVGTLLEKVGLRRQQANLYPHEFSGGQRQRIAIARALAPSPALVVADEPVSALDVSVQAQILNLMVELQREAGLAYLFIAHDIAVVAHISHTMLVMYRGRVVEYGLTHEIIGDARHPYTQALLEAVPRVGRRRRLVTDPVDSSPAAARRGGSMQSVSPTHAYLVEEAAEA